MYPILLTLGPLKIYSFGVFLILALILGSFIVWREGRQAKPDKFNEERLLDLILVEMIAGLAGARIYYLLLHFEDFGFSPFRWLLIIHFPGLSFIGAIIGGLIAALIFAKRTGWPFYQIGDLLVLGVSFGEIIGRIGAFFSGSSYGAPTNLPWGVPVIGLLDLRHPVQIYESLAALAIFLALLKLRVVGESKKLVSGILFFSYFILYGLLRLFLEFFRGDCVYFKGWRTTQIVCLVFVSAGLILLYRRLGRSVKTDILIFVQKLR